MSKRTAAVKACQRIAECLNEVIITEVFCVDDDREDLAAIN